MSESNLKIIAYDKPSGGTTQNEIASFTVDFNPNTFTISNKIEYQNPEAKGQTGGDPQFDKIPPLEFTIEFTIDGTGVAFNHLTTENQNTYKSQQNDTQTKHDYVKKQIIKLREVTGSQINGEIHRPNYLGLLWGNIYIECVLTSLNIVYSLFDRQGSPLRAKVTCGFLERIAAGQDGRQTRLESPDLTKIITTTEGDSLTLIANKKYDDPCYYIQIARKNKLKNFRRLNPGTKIVLPPLSESYVTE